MKKEKIKLKDNRVLIFVTLILICGLGVGSMLGTYHVLLDNSRSMGIKLVESYVADEERNIEVYRTCVHMGLYYLEEMEKISDSEEKLSGEMNSFLKKIASELDDPDLQMYVLKGDREIASNKGNSAEIKNYQSTEWYQKAEEAGGEVVFCDVSVEKTTNNNLTAVAAVDADKKSTIVVFLNRRNFNKVHMDLELMDQGAYYLCDEEGKLLFYDAPYIVNEEVAEKHVANMCKRIQNGTLESAGGGIIDVRGKKRDIYHSSVGNGWLCILTVPRASTLMGFYKILWNCGGVLAIFLLAMLGLYLRDLRRGNSEHYTKRMMQALSNDFYALYRINLKKETYVRFKGSQELEILIPDQGSYEQMLEGFGKVLDEKTSKELKKSFSLENMKRVSEQHIKNYGGDFLRKMNGKDSWVNIGVIQDDILGSDELMLVFRQIDVEKKRQLRHIQLLEDALNAAESSEKSQQKFFANMSHEMRTPLNIILGMNELAMGENCSPQRRLEYQKKLHHEAKKMSQMVNDVLEMSRPEHGLLPLQRKSMNLVEAIEDIVDPFWKQAEEDGKEFILETDVECPVVMGDALKLEKILYAVLSNALRFTEKGDRITVSLHQAGIDNQNYVFVIEDTGIGMSKEFLPRLFEPYSMEKRFGDRSAGGDGLGMSLARNLVIQKGGQIRAESEEGQGTRIIITLPFAPVIEATESKQQDQEATKPQQEKNCIKNLNILVVDDNEMNREFVGELLKEKGANVTLASGGKDAVDLFYRSEPFYYDAVIMDVMMPEMDGCEATRLIRALNRPDAGTVPVFALTANSFAEDVMRTMEAGMNAHLVKPLDMKILQETLQKFLKKQNSDKK